MRMKRKQKSLALAEQWRRAVHRGEWLPDTRLPKETELAAEHGVSRGTVRAALDLLESEKLLVRIRGKGTVVCHPTLQCKSVKIVLPGPSLDSSWSEFVQGIATEAHAGGIRTEIILCTPDHNRAHINLDAFRSLTPDDCIILLTLNWWRAILPILAENRCKVVCVDSNTSNASSMILPYIQNWKRLHADLPDIVCRCHRYLTLRKRKRTIIFHMTEQESKAYFSCLRTEKSAFDPRLFIPLDYQKGIQTDKNEIRRLRSILRPYLHKALFEAHADSIIFNNPALILPTVQLLESMEVAIPDEVACVSIRNFEVPECTLPISCFSFPMFALGRQCVKCFLTEYFSPQDIPMEPVFLERESSKKGAGNPVLPALDVPQNRIPIEI